ncbi:hypothetical protein ACFZB9_36215 [Kitasatospora sp. NPDC008050]|uniref:hypothetical protein n=1 Tax=Kitasatospora sp. NPDC008050 TaxID=3364021 RepID=UPI0036E14B0B
MTAPAPPPAAGRLSFDLTFLRERALGCRLGDDELTALTGIPTADWDTHLTPQTLPAAALIHLARALDTSPQSLLRTPGQDKKRPGPQVAAHATVLHAALMEAGRIHPDDLASALEWPPQRLRRAATALAAHLEQHDSPHRLVYTDTGIHLTTTPGLLTGRQRQNLHTAGHTAASLSPSEAAALTRLLHTAADGLPPELPPEQVPRLANRRLLAPTGGHPAPHPDVLFALALARHPLTDTLGPTDHQVAAPDPWALRSAHHPAAVRADTAARPAPVTSQPPEPR